MPETVRHVIVLADTDPLRRIRLTEFFEKWYGKQFPVVAAADAEDAGRVLPGLDAEEAQVVLVAAVADQLDAPDALELSESAAGGAGHL